MNAFCFGQDARNHRLEAGSTRRFAGRGNGRSATIATQNSVKIPRVEQASCLLNPASCRISHAPEPPEPPGTADNQIFRFTFYVAWSNFRRIFDIVVMRET